MKNKYNKAPKSIAEQIDLLKMRGMKMPPDSESILTHLSYYRLCAYWRHLEIDDKSPLSARNFRAGVKFIQVINCYNFDCKLRLLLLEVIQHIEISVRTQLAHHLSRKDGAYAHLSAELFVCPKLHQECQETLNKEAARSKEMFIQYFAIQYNSPPPIWAAVEIMSFGLLSKWYKNTTPTLRRQIAAIYKMDEKILISFLHSLTNIRNDCAHHGRLWNKRLALVMHSPRKKQKYLYSLYNKKAPRKIYNIIFRIIYILEIIAPNNDWKQRLLALLNDYNNEFAKPMGFPDKWQEMEFWRTS